MVWGAERARRLSEWCGCIAGVVVTADQKTGEVKPAVVTSRKPMESTKERLVVVQFRRGRGIDGP
jgi:hypothetical protein